MICALFATVFAVAHATKCFLAHGRERASVCERVGIHIVCVIVCTRVFYVACHESSHET